MKQIQNICLLTFIALRVFTALSAEAAIQCYQCHGTQSPIDYRPLDSTCRNASSGGFQGNHRTHMGDSATPITCNTCHPGSGNYNSSHRDGRIKVSSRINNSLLTTLYKNTTTAWHQTATPTLESCSNINCHFEATTPAWGNDQALTTCGTCHGAPPSGTASTYLGGAAGSHAKHDLYYPGSNNCKKCHPDNATFAHATSAAKHDLKISFAAAPNNCNGSYTGPLNDYLPSLTNVFGNCSNTYCHDDGTSLAIGTVPANTSPLWGSGSIPCSGCHGFPPTYGNGLPKANSHIKHAALGVGCNTCHAGTTADGTTITSTTPHVNRSYDVIPGTGVSFSYVFATTGGTCSNISCHNDGSAVWGATLTCGDCHTVSPGGD